ncbi:hypothetical protein ACH4TX_42000 [Streptomyces sp. NPDC021098]|uniref:hypothetical protein n=1 Tax=unclassified Streptomyces TaxID=2593676 RepID=UPI003795B3D1
MTNARDELYDYATAPFKETGAPEIVQNHVSKLIAARDAEVLRQAVTKLRERAGELSELAEEKMSRALEERAQEWHEAAELVRRMADQPAP